MSVVMSLKRPGSWKTKTTRVAKKRKELWENKLHCDCTFTVGPTDLQKVFKAHKVFLSTSSPVFEAMLSNEKESSEDILIPDVLPEAFDALLKFIYTGVVNIDSVECASNVWYAARKYMVPEMENDCVTYLQNELCSNNVCQIYELAKLFEEQKLEQQCLNLISHNMLEVISTSSFEDAQLTTLENILDLDVLSVESELLIFKAVERWAKKECARKGFSGNVSEQKTVLKTILPKIRFLTLSLEDFTKNIAPSLLFTRDELFALLLNLSSVKSVPPVPEGFSTCRDLRKCPVGGITKGNERFCRRKVVCEALLLNDGNLKCSVHFQTNFTIQFLGVEVCTQLFSYEVELLDANTFPVIHSGTHVEEYEVSLQQQFNTTSVTKSDKVKFDSSTNIFFNKPIQILPSFDTYLTIKMKSKGWYPAGVCSPITQVKSTVFSFFTENNQGSVAEGLIKSIVFRF